MGGVPMVKDLICRIGKAACENRNNRIDRDDFAGAIRASSRVRREETLRKTATRSNDVAT